MILLCCGDRGWKDGSFIRTILLTYYHLHTGSNPLRIIEGDCRGADRMSRAAARTLRLTVETYPANWQRDGLAAGPIRNRVMLDRQPDIVLAFHDNLEASVGTKDCVVEATDRSIPVHHYRHGGPGLDAIHDRDGRLVHFLPF